MGSMFYIALQLDEALFQGEVEYTLKVTKSEQKICTLIEAGFEYVTDFQGSKIFKKKITKQKIGNNFSTTLLFDYNGAGGGI